MSAALAYSPAVRATAAPGQTAPLPARAPHLRPVSPPSRSRSVLPFVLLCVAISIGSLVAVLMLNTTMAAQAYEQRALHLRSLELAEARAALLTALEAKGSPQSLAAQARELGMRPATAVGFIVIADGRVIAPERGR